MTYLTVKEWTELFKKLDALDEPFDHLFIRMKLLLAQEMFNQHPKLGPLFLKTQDEEAPCVY